MKLYCLNTTFRYLIILVPLCFCSTVIASGHGDCQLAGVAPSACLVGGNPGQGDTCEILVTPPSTFAFGTCTTFFNSIIPLTTFKCLCVVPASPLSIELASFDAFVQDGQVILNWITGAEIDNAGFNILRSKFEEGPYIKANDALIPAKATPPGGADYSFVDTEVKYFVDASVEGGWVYFYTLEDVDTSGDTAQHGPLEIKVVEGATASFDVSTEQVEPAAANQSSTSRPSSGGCSVAKTGSGQWDTSLAGIFFGWILWRIASVSRRRRT